MKWSWAAALASLLTLASALPAAARNADAILKTMEHVADWELAHPDQAAYPVNSPESRKPLGWVVGTFYTGLTALAERSGDPRYAKAVFDLGAREKWALGPRPFHADDYEVAQNWVWAYGRAHDPKTIAAVRERFDAIIAADPKDSLLMVPARGGVGGCFRRWCWSDALFMGPPGWVALAQATGEHRYQAYADKEYAATTALLFEASRGLYYRDSSFFGKKGAQGEPIFWSRGNGWAYAGLARILTMLPADSPSRPYYRKLFLAMSKALLPLQKANGTWAPSLLDPRPDTPPETSGTAFFTYGIAWGVDHGLLKGVKWRRAADKGWAALTRALAVDGRLGWVQQVGSQPDSVTADNTQPYGVGAFLLAGSAMMDLASPATTKAGR
jgi:rhamnogalacturonyl hydrolase YesR